MRGKLIAPPCLDSLCGTPIGYLLASGGGNETTPVDKNAQLIEFLVLVAFFNLEINNLDIELCYEYSASATNTLTDVTSQNEVIWIQLKFNTLSATDYSFIYLLSYFGNTANTANYTARIDLITATTVGVPIADVVYTLPFPTLPIYPDANATHQYNSSLCPTIVPIVGCPVYIDLQADGSTTYEEGTLATTISVNFTGSDAGWTYQWEIKTNNVGLFVPIPLATASSYQMPLSQASGVYQLRCIITKPLGSTCTEPSLGSVTFDIFTNCLSGLCADPNFFAGLLVATNNPIDYNDGFVQLAITNAYWQSFVDLQVTAGCYTVTVTGDNQVDGGGNRLAWIQVKYEALNEGDISFILLQRVYGNDSDQFNFTTQYDWVRKVLPLTSPAMNDVAFVTPYLPTVIADPTHSYYGIGLSVCS